MSTNINIDENMIKSLLHILNKGVDSMSLEKSSFYNLSMEQSTDLIRRAEKQYKGKNISFLFNEVLMNSIQSCYLKSQNNDNYKDCRLSISIVQNKDHDIIKIKDNGGGFTPEDRKVFLKLDAINKRKEEAGFNPKGEGGRLTVVYFANSVSYETIVHEDDQAKKIKFEYIDTDAIQSKQQVISEDLFNEKETLDKLEDTMTEVVLLLKGGKRRALRSFIDRYSKDTDTNSIAKNILNNFIETFFPFFISKNIDFKFDLQYQNNKVFGNSVFSTHTFDTRMELDRSKINSSSFTVDTNEQKKPIIFSLYILKDCNKKNNILNFCARGLIVKWLDKITYRVNEKDIIYIVSDYLDSNVDTRGDIVSITDNVLFDAVKKGAIEKLNTLYKEQIKDNKNHNKELLKNLKDKHKIVSRYLSYDEDVFYKLNEKEALEQAFKDKMNDEINLSLGKDATQEVINKVLKSSLTTYIRSREKILTFYDNLLVQDENGKYVKEEDMHKLIFSRDNTEDNNLWLLDDKYNYFDISKSTNNGDKGSDIYLYYTQDKTRYNPSNVVLIELKRPGKKQAHNPKNMLRQIKEQAKDFYLQKTLHLGRNVKTTDCTYEGYIIADTNDIETLKDTESVFTKIPGFGSYYFCTVPFYNINDNKSVSMIVHAISYEDIATLSKRRNQIFFDKINKQQ